MRDEFFALHIAERVLELHQLNEEIVFGVELWRVHRALEVEGEPFLDAMHPGSFGEIEEQRQIEDDRRRENAVAAQKVDLELHRVPEPPDDVDVVPPLFVVAPRRGGIDSHDMAP